MLGTVSGTVSLNLKPDEETSNNANNEGNDDNDNNNNSDHVILSLRLTLVDFMNEEIGLALRTSVLVVGLLVTGNVLIEASQNMFITLFLLKLLVDGVSLGIFSSDTNLNGSVLKSYEDDIKYTVSTE